MSFASHPMMEYPNQAHFAQKTRSFSRPLPVDYNATLPPLNIEAAKALKLSREQNTGNSSQWSDNSWGDTAVDRSSNDFDGYSRRSSKDGKSILESRSELDLHHGSKGSPSYNRYEKTPFPISIPSMQEPPLRLPHQIALVGICCLAQFLNLAGMNQTVAPVMILSDYFDIRDYGTLSWFSAAYSMSVGAFILPAGNIGMFRVIVTKLIHGQVVWVICLVTSGCSSLDGFGSRSRRASAASLTSPETSYCLAFSGLYKASAQQSSFRTLWPY
jgi:hypothetical protein